MKLGGKPDRDAEHAREIAALRIQLDEAEQTLQAIRKGEVDALVVDDAVYTLDSANAASNRLRSDVLAQMKDAVVAVDLDGRLIYLNAAAETQYGIAASAALGHPLEQLYRVRWYADADRVRCEEELREKGSWRGESLHVRADGSELHAESTLTALRDSAGVTTGHLMVSRDISERYHAAAALQRAAEALREADRRKDVFIATLAHELRNPLAPIGNAIEIMRLSADPQTHVAARGMIERQLHQLVHLVDDLLDVSRISQGKLELRRDRVELAAVVRNAVETSRPLIDAGRHELVIEPGPVPAIVLEGDMTRLTQVVANLLNNAAKYTPSGGRITVTTLRDGRDALVRVVDTGIGIPSDRLPDVFEMFAQVDRTSARTQGGLGIGLALVKRLVEMHGGSVDVTSAGPGRGSRFEVRLPALAHPGMIARQAGSRDADAASGDGSRILIADDNRDSADSMAMMLGLLGFDTTVVYDGEGAIEAASALRPRVAILDLGMPRVTGDEVARRLRSEEWAKDMILIALSGWGRDDDRRKTAEAGFDHHLVKPLDLHALSLLLAPVAGAPKAGR